MQGDKTATSVPIVPTLQAWAFVQKEAVDSNAVWKQRRQPLHAKAQLLQPALPHDFDRIGSLDPSANGLHNKQDDAKIAAMGWH